MQALLTLVEQYGLWLVFANVLALQCGLPVPAYPTLIVVGAITARGDITVPQVIAVATVASLIADFAWYFAGARHGRRVLRLMCRLSLSPDSCVRQTESIYERWGAPSLVIAKFVPGFAAVATSMAGMVRTRLTSFALFDAIGALLWSGVAVALGWVFRDAVNEVLAVFAQAGRWGLLALIVALALLVLSGLAIWKPVQLQELTALMGGYEGARIVHFLCMAAVVLIVIVHVAMVALVPRTLPTMITGRAP